MVHIQVYNIECSSIDTMIHNRVFLMFKYTPLYEASTWVHTMMLYLFTHNVDVNNMFCKKKDFLRVPFRWEKYITFFWLF